MRRLLTIAVVAAFALVGDLRFLRLWCAMLIGAATVFALYGFFLPPIQPRWPAILIMTLAILGGMRCEHLASARTPHR